MSNEPNEPFVGIAEFSSAVVNMAKQAKSLLCQAERGPTDAPPMLVWHCKEDIALCGMPPPDDNNPAYLVLARALSDGFAEFGVPRFVSMIVEAYAWQGDEDDVKPDEILRGELHEKFQRLDPRVSEVITILTFDMENELHSDMVFYKYDDAGQPMFQEVVHEDSATDTEAKGAIVDVIQEFRKFCKGF